MLLQDNKPATTPTKTANAWRPRQADATEVIRRYVEVRRVVSTKVMSDILYINVVTEKMA